MTIVLARTSKVDSDRSRKAKKGDREAKAFDSKETNARPKKIKAGNGRDPNGTAGEDRRAPWHGNDGK